MLYIGSMEIRECLLPDTMIIVIAIVLRYKCHVLSECSDTPFRDRTMCVL